MKKAEVQIGAIYVVKVSNVLTTVKIDRPRPTGGWDATNTRTGRSVIIRSAAKLRREAATAVPAAIPERKPVVRRLCKCGQPMSKWATECRNCTHTRMQEMRAKALEVVQKGVCPVCGQPLRQNLALAGWYQCAQFGAAQFRTDPSKPVCSYQITVPSLG